MKKQRIVSAAVCCCMLASIFAACSKPKTEPAPSSAATTSTQAKSGVSGKGILPISQEKQKLSVVIPQNPAVSDYNDNLMTKYLEEKTNIKVEWQVTPSADIVQKINLMIASGQNLPDIFMSSLTQDLISNYAEKNIFVPVNQYLDTQSQYFAPFLKAKPFVEKSLFLPDGKIYAFPETLPAGSDTSLAIHSDVSGKMWVNKTWLKAAGLEEPKTTEDFANMLRAFKNKDLNGNGKKDEIAMIGANKGSWDGFPESFLINAFVQYDTENQYFIDKSGSIQASYATNEYREALKYMNKLVAEGLIDPVTYTQDNAQLKQMVEAQTVVVGSYPSGASSMAVSPNTERFKEYTAIAPLKGPNGVQLTKTRLYSTETKKFSAITTACKVPEIAFKWLDYWFSDDIALRNKYGVEGTHWSKPAAGEMGLDGKQAKIKIVKNLYTGDPQNVRLGNNFGYSARFMNTIVRSDNPYDSERYYIELSQKYFPYVPKAENYVVNYFYSTQDSKVMSEVNNVLKTYVDEARIKFILGINNVNDDKVWGQYMAEIEKIGYKKVLDIMQKRKNSVK